MPESEETDISEDEKKKNKVLDKIRANQRRRGNNKHFRRQNSKAIKDTAIDGANNPNLAGGPS